MLNCPLLAIDGSSCGARRRFSGDSGYVRCTVVPTAGGVKLPPLELRPPLLREGPDTLLVVLAVEAVGDELLEMAQVALGRWAEQLPHAGLGRAQGERSVLGHHVGVRARECLELR